MEYVFKAGDVVRNFRVGVSPDFLDFPRSLSAEMASYATQAMSSLLRIGVMLTRRNNDCPRSSRPRSL